MNILDFKKTEYLFWMNILVFLEMNIFFWMEDFKKMNNVFEYIFWF